MPNDARISAVDTDDSRVRAAAIVLMGSCFSLFLFLDAPDFASPYYVFAVGTMVFAVLFAGAMLASVSRE